MNKKGLSALILSTLITIISFSQSLTLQESAELQRKVYYFFENNRPQSETEETVKGRPSEAFICLLNIDSIGKVASVHLLSDDSNRGLAYTIFSKMIPESFNNWKCEKCIYKTIMIPINVQGGWNNNRPDYVKDLIFSTALKPGEERNLIIIRGVNFYWPTIKE